jgi:CheY-like chemotaxis protein
MSNSIQHFGKIATILSRRPLGILALFIVLVYGLASLLIISGGDFTPTERLPFVYFLVFFPILLLGVFVWLVSKHGDKIVDLGQFEDKSVLDEESKRRASHTADFTANIQQAQMKMGIEPVSDAEMRQSADLGWAVYRSLLEPTEPWRNQILWVDDMPGNNVYERRAFEAMGLHCTPVSSTDAAFESLAHGRYAAIISDMEREEGPREGYKLLDNLRQEGNQTPLFFYTSSNAPEHRQEALQHGAQGSTNDPRELIEMVARAVGF